ncbi:MAG: RNA-binding protein [Saprospiraceae bacterium]|jgi:RNA recognition motif-containing protein|nr:RNA-binding protein [Saprospiraceae bacterium]MBL0026120.1 RNA-binding protein [Saprospiraceae bacterium]
MEIFVGSIPFKWKEMDLEELFTPFGEVTSVKIIIDKITRQNKGFGFVSMPDASSANAAIKALEGFEIDGRKISVSISLPKSEVDSRKKYLRNSKRVDYKTLKNQNPKKKRPPWERNEY